MKLIDLLMGNKGPAKARTLSKCVDAPIGCGKSIDVDTEFRDHISKVEYSISALCQDCQDNFYESEDLDDV